MRARMQPRPSRIQVQETDDGRWAIFDDGEQRGESYADYGSANEYARYLVDGDHD